MACCQACLNLSSCSDSNYLSSSLSSPLSSRLSYLISPHALPLQVPCRPHFLSADLILVYLCQDGVISSFWMRFDNPPLRALSFSPTYCFNYLPLR